MRFCRSEEAGEGALDERGGDEQTDRKQDRGGPDVGPSLSKREIQDLANAEMFGRWHFVLRPGVGHGKPQAQGATECRTGGH